MPLTEKGEKILASMKKQYGPEKGEQVFYASKNAGKLSGVDDSLNPGWKVDIAFPNEKSDDNQHLGFTKGEAAPVEKLVSECDALAKRLDAFESRQHQRKPEQVKPRTKDGMQPSDPHPKEVK
jgi:hypothetical protein